MSGMWLERGFPMDGEDFPVMLTTGNLALIRTRAQRQPEDSPAHSQLKELRDLLR